MTDIPSLPAKTNKEPVLKERRGVSAFVAALFVILIIAMGFAGLHLWTLEKRIALLEQEKNRLSQQTATALDDISRWDKQLAALNDKVQNAPETPAAVPANEAIDALRAEMEQLKNQPALPLAQPVNDVAAARLNRLQAYIFLEQALSSGAAFSIILQEIMNNTTLKDSETDLDLMALHPFAETGIKTRDQLVREFREMHTARSVTAALPEEGNNRAPSWLKRWVKIHGAEDMSETQPLQYMGLEEMMALNIDFPPDITQARGNEWRRQADARLKAEDVLAKLRAAPVRVP